MARSVRVAVGVASMWAVAWLSVACGGKDHGSGVNGMGSSGSAGSSTNSSAGSQGFNLGGDTGDGSGNSGGLGPTCAAHVSTAMPVPLDMYLMLDVSGSMLDKTAALTSKWDAVKSALESFLKDPDSAGLGVGLQYFPLLEPMKSCTRNSDCGASGCLLKFCQQYSTILPCQASTDCLDPTDLSYYGPCVPLGQCSANADYVCGAPGVGECGKSDMNVDLGSCDPITSSICVPVTSCDVTRYATPAAPIAALPGATSTLITSIDAQMPSGDTPTSAALSGALQQASDWAKAHPDHRVVAVLATDGLPTECAPQAIKDVAALAKAGVAATPSISTFVIGVFGPADVQANAPDNLNQIADQGGTKSAFIVDTQQDVSAQFLKALDTIRGSRLGCEFQIPEPSGSQTLDYGRVNVQFKTGGQTDYVFHVNEAKDCDPKTGGWYYDADPSSGSPSRIIACPTTCSSFQAAPDGSSVGIALGCTTMIK